MPDIASLCFAVLAVLAAGYVRGYSGFGFSMIAVLCLSLVLPTAAVVPTIMILEVAASVSLLPKVWKDIDWLSLKWILPGVLVGTPLGAYILATTPDALLKVCISLVVIALVVLLWRGFRLTRTPGPAATGLVGLISGILNGGAGIAGPPVVLFYFSSPRAVAAGRASLIALFLATDVIALGNFAVQGLIGLNTVKLTALFVPPLLAGIVLGSRAFVKANEQTFRLRVLQILLVLSAASLVKAAWGWF